MLLLARCCRTGIPRKSAAECLRHTVDDPRDRSGWPRSQGERTINWKTNSKRRVAAAITTFVAATAGVAVSTGLSVEAATSTSWLVASRQSTNVFSAATQVNAAASTGITRGLFRFTSTDWASMHSAGFNASTDGGVQSHGTAQSAAGITGMVWVDAYNNPSCAQTMTDAAITSIVRANVNAGLTGLRYQIGDEPMSYGCNAPPTYTHITQLVHAADATAKTWVADGQFQLGDPVKQGVPMKGERQRVGHRVAALASIL
jgi:hypothetical protein